MQIGPRIRVGGTLGKLGEGIKKGKIKDIGHALGEIGSSKAVQGVTSGLLAATGVGAPLAAAIAAGMGGAGNLMKPGGNLGKAARGAASGAAIGATGAGLGSAARGAITSGGGIGGAIKNAAGSLVRGGGADGKGNFGRLGDMAGNALMAGQGGGANGTDGAGGGNDTLTQILKLAGLLGGGAMAVKGIGDANRTQGRADSLLDRATQLAGEQADYGRELIGGARPIRQASERAMLEALNRGPATAPNLSFLTDQANPFAARFQPPPAPAAPPQPRPMLPPPPPNMRELLPPGSSPSLLRRIAAAQSGGPA